MGAVAGDGHDGAATTSKLARLTAQLRHARERIDTGPPPFRLQLELRHLLYAIEAIASLHLAKEEEQYFPLLDHLFRRTPPMARTRRPAAMDADADVA